MRHMKKILAFLIVVGCHSSTAPKRNPEYPLRTVEGKALPVVVGGMFKVTSGSITLNPDSTFKDWVAYEYGGYAITDSLVGKYSHMGDSLLFWAPDRGVKYSAGFDGKTITVTAWGFREEYRQ